MRPSYPCPNPTCAHAFSPDAVTGAAKLICPNCGTVFHFAAGTSAPARPPASKKTTPPNSKPTAPPPPPIAVPIAQPVAMPKVPLAAPAGASPETDLDFSSTKDLVVPRTRQTAKRREKRSGSHWFLLTVAGILGLALSVWAGMWLKHFFKKAHLQDDPTYTAEDYNARFTLPNNKSWQKAPEIQLKLHVHIGMKSTVGHNYLAIAFRDYKTRTPSDAEMLDEALSKLRSYFQGLEWEQKPKEEEAVLAGRAARVLEFQGDTVDSVTMNGECYTMTYRGQGYWFFTWAPLGDLEQDGDAIRTEWAKLRQGFKTLNQRGGWKEKSRETVPLVGNRVKYRLAYVKGLWTLEKPEAEDGPLDLLLRGHEPDSERKPLAGKDAVLQVLVLPKQTNLKTAAAAAFDFVQQREKKLYEQMKMEPIKDKNGDVNRDAEIGKEPGHLSKWRMKCTEDLERYLLVAVVNRTDGVVVLVGECLWERRDFWDQEFMTLLGSFTAKVR